MVGDAVVVPHHGIGVRGGRSGHVDVLDVLAQRQEAAVVLEQDHGLHGGRVVVGAADHGRRDPVVRAVGVVEQDAEPELGHQQRLQGLVDVRLREESALDGVLQGVEGVAALQVQARLDGDGAGFRRVAGDVVAAVDVIHRAAVRHHVSVEAPLVAEDVHQQELAAGCAVAEHAVVGAHHDLHVRFLHQLLESRQVGLVQVFHGRDRVVAVAGGFGTGVYRIMLRAGGGLQVERVVSLDAFYIGRAERSGEERVFSVGLHAAAPPGIPEDVHVGRPEGKPREAAVVLHLAGLVEFGPAFIGDDVADLPDQFRIEGGAQADGFGEDGGAAVAGHAVQGLVPPVVRLDTQPLHTGRAVHHHADLLVQGHPGDHLGRLLVHRGFLGFLGVGARGQEKSRRQGQEEGFQRHINGV